ncbi:hypothetical protein Syun_025656 [Stephania yunnanensis]|uniref:Uncharacterized protein n=1 Tax=Stephania yunnanensis TaxID=152371 RepID=A0AAP0HVZ2_9MAGN
MGSTSKSGFIRSLARAYGNHICGSSNAYLARNWTNYLRPGIKRGNFTSHEERMIVHLQALLDIK